MLSALPDQSQFFQTIWYIIKTFYPIILYGLGITFLLSVVGTVGGFVLSISLTQARLVNIDRKRDKKANIFFKAATRLVANGYVTLFRGTPMIVQSMIIFYGISALKIFPWWTPLTAGLIIVTINTTAYISEVLRGSVQGISVGQMEAGRSLGLTHGQTMRKIIWPQAIKNSLPGIGNEFVVNLKDTAVLSVISVVDLFYAVRQSASSNYRYVEAFIVAAIIYLIITYTSSKVIAFLEKRIGTVRTEND